MFGMMEALLSFIRRQVGLRTDTASSTGSLHAKLAYIENNTGVKSIQRGVLENASATPQTVTISAVNTNKSFVLVSGDGVHSYHLDGTASPDTYWGFVQASLTSSTQITVKHRDYGNDFEDSTNVSISWQVIEFY